VFSLPHSLPLSPLVRNLIGDAALTLGTAVGSRKRRRPMLSTAAWSTSSGNDFNK